MTPRFCNQCGARVGSPKARFCAECGAGLDARTSRGAESHWQLTPGGLGVFGFLVVSGLAIWVAILSPAPPRARPGANAQRTASGPDLPEGHPPVSREALEQVKSVLAELRTKAEAAPDDVGAWVHLGQATARAAQLDPSYLDEAERAFQHVLAKDAANPDALRGLANVFYDRRDHQQATPLYERYLKLRPDDLSARTDLGTMYLYGGNPPRAIATYKDVLARNPSFLQAHYNLAVTYHQQGNDSAALAEARKARALADDDTVRGQIDEMISALGGEPAPSAASTATPPSGPRSPFQSAVEDAFRQHQIMGPKIVGFEWSGPATGRVLMRDFPMQAMPPEVRDKFTERLGESLRAARGAHPVGDPVRMEIADATSGTVMATVTP